MRKWPVLAVIILLLVISAVALFVARRPEPPRIDGSSMDAFFVSVEQMQKDMPPEELARFSAGLDVALIEIDQEGGAATDMKFRGLHVLNGYTAEQVLAELDAYEKNHGKLKIPEPAKLKWKRKLYEELERERILGGSVKPPVLLSKTLEKVGEKDGKATIRWSVSLKNEGKVEWLVSVQARMEPPDRKRLFEKNLVTDKRMAPETSREFGGEYELDLAKWTRYSNRRIRVSYLEPEE